MVGRSGSNRRPTDCEASQSRRSAAIFARFVLSCWWLVDPRRGSLSIWCATQVPRRFGPQRGPVQSLLVAARRVTRGVATHGPRTVGRRSIAPSREVISRLRSSGSWRESTACGASQGMPRAANSSAAQWLCGGWLPGWFWLFRTLLVPLGYLEKSSVSRDTRVLRVGVVVRPTRRPRRWRRSRRAQIRERQCRGRPRSPMASSAPSAAQRPSRGSLLRPGHRPRPGTAATFTPVIAAGMAAQYALSGSWAARSS